MNEAGYHCDVDWSDPMLYHLVINTGKWDIEAAAHLIVNGVSYLPAAESSGQERSLSTAEEQLR